MMELTYDGVALHDLGDLTIVPAYAFDPAESPQKKIVRLAVTIDIDSDNYHDGKTKWWSVLSAINGKQGAELLWHNPSATAGQRDYHNPKVATCANVDLPEDPAGWGTYYTQVKLTFSWEEALSDVEAQNMTVRFTGSGGSEQALGSISQWVENFQNEYFDPDLDGRRRSGCSITVAGSFNAAVGDALTDRRTDLFTRKDALVAEVNKKTGTLVYRKPDGTTLFNKVVKVDRLTANVNQAKQRIDWTMEVHYTQFPDLADFGSVEFDVSEREAREEGQFTVTFSGTVKAPDEVDAVAKLDAIRPTALAGYSTRIQISREHTPAHKDAGDDGQSFFELRFSESYKVFQVQAAGVTSVRFAYGRRKDWVNLSQRTSFRGEVFGSHQLLMDCVNEVSGNFLGKFLAAIGASGSLLSWDVSAPREYVPSSFTSNSDALTTPVADRAQQVSFAVEYEGSMSDADQVLSCEVTESVQYSGTRHVTHDIAGGVSVVQASGTAPGKRSVSGRVQAASYSAAWNYAHGKQALLTGWDDSGAVPPVGPDHIAPDPPKVDVRYAFDARVEGVADDAREGGTTNVRVYEASFTFGEILANYPMPGAI